MGKGSLDDSGAQSLSNAAWAAIASANAEREYGRKQYEKYSVPVLNQYAQIVGGGQPAYAAAQKSGLFDPYVRQLGSWERGQREKALDVAGLGPASKYMATTGISQQAEGMKSQGIMGQLTNMMNQLTGTGQGMYGTAGQMATAMQGQGFGMLGQAAQMQQQQQLLAQQAQAGMWGNIVGSIASIGGMALGMGMPWKDISGGWGMQGAPMA